MEDYINFQKKSQSPFNVVENIANRLKALNYIPLNIDDNWNLKTNQGYFVPSIDSKSIIAFYYQGHEVLKKKGFSIVGAHTDSPTLKLKYHPFDAKNGLYRLMCQYHGSIIYRSLLDRPMILAGRIYYTSSDGKLLHKNVITENPIAIIPDLAIHLDRNKNTQGEINPEVHLHPIVGTFCSESESKDLASKIFKLFDVSNPKRLSEVPQLLGGKETSTAVYDLVNEERSDAANNANEALLAASKGWELFLSPYWPHLLCGLENELITGPRHDDLAMVFSALKGLETASSIEGTPVLSFLDAEETGSRTLSGAQSCFLTYVLGRIMAQNTTTAHKSIESEHQILSKSFALSADMAHAVHPSFAHKHDEYHRPSVNGGLVLKENANDNYASSGYSSSIFKMLCEKAGVKLQAFVIKQDQSCGSTIGPFMASKLGCHVVDFGIPMWAMHSMAETMGVHDLNDAISLFKCFFEKGFEF